MNTPTSEPAAAVAPATQEPIAVTVLSGFLGSGKTTLLNYLLHHNHGQKLALIVNEFGSVGIDGALVAGGEQFVQLDNGCLCCALNDDLRETLIALVARAQAGERIDRIVIESTGLADPLPVAWAATRPEVSRALRVDAIVTVVDAANVARALAESREATLQLTRADLVVLNKVDLVADRGAAAAAQVTAINALAPQFVATHGQVPWSWIMATPHGGEAMHAGASVQASAQGQKPDDVHAHDHGHACAPACAHNHNPAADNAYGHAAAPATTSPHAFVSWSYVGAADAVFDEARCEDLAFAVPPEVIRFKGLLRVNDAEGDWLLVHGVGGRVDVRFLQLARPPARSVWVFFGRQLDVDALRQLCTEHLGAPTSEPIFNATR